MTDVLPTLIAVGGWLGAAALLAGYFMVSRGRLAGDSLRYQALNIMGAVLLLINCAYTGAWPSAVSNVFYLGVGMTIIFTVKRAYLAQLARSRGAEVSARLRRSGQAAQAVGRTVGRGRGVTAAPAAMVPPAALR